MCAMTYTDGLWVVVCVGVGFLWPASGTNRVHDDDDDDDGDGGAGVWWWIPLAVRPEVQGVLRF